MSPVRIAHCAITIFLLTFCSCGFNLANYTRAVKSGFKKLPEAMQIESLFGEADHFISYSGPNVKQDWSTVVYFGGRYTLTMQIEVKTNSAYGGFSEITEVVGEPRFYLWEASDITISPKGSVETSFSRNGGEFSLSDWKKVYAAKGDFSVIGISIKKDPVEDFDAYVEADRAPRVRVRPD